MSDLDFWDDVKRSVTPWFDGRDMERLAWMRGMLARYQKQRHEIERQAASDWWMEGDERWRRVA